MRASRNNKAPSIIWIITVIVSAVLIFAGNRIVSKKVDLMSHPEMSAKAKVTELGEYVEDTNDGINFTAKTQYFYAKILSGPEKGKTVSAVQEIDSYTDTGERFVKKGDRVVLYNYGAVYGTDQWVFGNYAGDKYVPHTLEIVLPDGKVGVKSNTDWESPRLGNLNVADSQRFYNRFSSSVVHAKGKTIVKLVNTTAFPMPVEADFSRLGVGAKGRTAEVVVMAGAFDANDVKPVKSQEKISAKFERTLPAYSLTVIAF